MRDPANRIAVGYLGALASTAAAILIRAALDPLLGDRLPFALVVASLSAIVWLAGLGPGLVAAVLGYVAADWFFVSPRHTFGVQSVDDVTSMIGYFIVAGSVLGFGEAARRARERAEERARELERAEESLRESDRRKDEFLAMLGHELRNPLAPIRNAVEILNAVGSAGNEARSARAIINRQVSHMARLLDDLLDVSRIARGKIRLRQERCDLARIARNTVEDYRPTLTEAGLAVRMESEADRVWVDGDPQRLAQIVGNLLHNARKFTGPGGTVVVRTASVDGGAVELSVRDTGIGIAPAVLPRLFEPFVQADEGLDRSRGGLGIGLALVRGIVGLHGGTVSAQSDGAGKGALFTLRLPSAGAPAACVGEPQSLFPVTAPPPAAERPIRVLVIEDHADTAASLRMLLELSGHEAEIAHTGAAGIAAASRLRPEVVFCDIGLPGLDGYQVARALRERPDLSGSFLVALTGYGQDQDRERAREAGFDLHLTKPINFAVVERTLAAAVAGRRAIQPSVTSRTALESSPR